MKQPHVFILEYITIASAKAVCNLYSTAAYAISDRQIDRHNEF